MSRIKEVTVSLDITVQPKQYQSMKLGLTVTRTVDEDEGSGSLALVDDMRRSLSRQLREGLREEVENIYGKAVADFVVNQAPAMEPRRAPVQGGN